jgi:UDP-glucuronate 4-epimerase
MNVLVTGGAGFIASHLSEFLLRRGNRLTLIDDLNDFYSPQWKRRNLEEIRRVGDFDFHHIDLCDSEAVERIVAAVRPEVIVHMAARAGVRPSLEQPLLYERVNVLGTLGLLEAARRHRVRRFVFASSSSVYGVTNNIPFSEDDRVNRPISPYAASKLAGEQHCFTYSHLYGLQVCCLRFFTVYGPRQRPDLAIRKFTTNIDLDKAIPVFGDGTTSRDYTYVDDIVNGVVAALHHNGSYDIFNLGNSSPIRLIDMIRTIEDALGKPAKIEWLPQQPGDVPITYADIDKARSVLRYDPVTPFPEGIQRFVRWYRQAAHEYGAK